ncbi:MAG: hypothetical protein RLY97_1443 [Pseudomonadota bacterium]|jgi:hypothetical protein
MEQAARKLMSIMPFLFGIGFIAPLIAQVMLRWQIAAPLGLSPTLCGLAIGGSWGLIANLRGRWL